MRAILILLFLLYVGARKRGKKMVKEYCDRCKVEIDPCERLSKKVVKITIPNPQSWEGCTRSVTLHSECFSKMGVQEAVKNVASGDKDEKEPAAVDKLLDIIKELINDCMEERGV